MRRNMAIGLACGMVTLAAQASVAIFEFTGTSSENNQFNTVTVPPENGDFGPFTRVNVNWRSGANVFNSQAWNQGSTLDPAEYVGFTITPHAGFELNLNALSFASQRSGTGPTAGRIALFVNGSTVPQESLDFSPTTSQVTYTFDFTDLAHLTGAEFRFYGSGASSAQGTLQFDNVDTLGGFAPIPEPTAGGWVVILGLLGGSVGQRILRCFLRRT
jgi:hypothetical protein